MRSVLLLFLCFFGIAGHLQAQVGHLSGRILDMNESLPGAHLQILNTNLIAVSDREGRFSLKDIPAGSQQIRITMLGYSSYEEQIEVPLNSILKRNFQLSRDALRLEQVVVTGTRTPVLQYDSPVIVSTLSNKTFEATQSVTLSEGLSFTPGLRVENNCQNCGFTQLRMNGLAGSYSQILINSRPVFSALAGVYGLEMLPAAMIDRVEVVRGGGSAMYGGNAIAGTVNIITKDPLQNSFEAGWNHSFTGLEAPDRIMTMNASLVGKKLNRGISVYGYLREREHWDADGDGFSELTKLDAHTLGFDMFINSGQRSKIKIGANSIGEFRRGGNDFNLEPHQSDLAEQLIHRILSTNISFEQYSKNYKHKFAVYAALQLIDRESYYGGGGRVLVEGDTLNANDSLALNAYGNSTDVSAVSGIQYAFDINKELILTAGSELQHNKVLDKMPGYGRAIDQEVSTAGNYLQLQYKPIAKLILLAGARYDHVYIRGRYDFEEERLSSSKSLNVLVPRLAVMYDLSKTLKARISMAKGYRAPQAFNEDLHIETVGGAARFIVLSPDLLTERSDSYTASLNFGSGPGATQVSAVLEGFYTRLSDPFILSDQQQLPSGVSMISKRNGSGASVQGINAEANFAGKKGIIFQSGVTLQSATYMKQELIWEPEEQDDLNPPTRTKVLLRTPNVYGYYTLQYEHKSRISISCSGLFTGKMHVPHVVDAESGYTLIKKTPSFFEQHLKVSYKFDIGREYRIQIHSGVQNIFNSYQRDFDRGASRDAAYVYGPNRPRTIFMGIKFVFQGSN